MLIKLLLMQFARICYSAIVKRVMWLVISGLLLLGLSPAYAQTTGVCDRTSQVRDAIVELVDGVDNCANITLSHLAEFDFFLLFFESDLTALRSGDFDGMTNLTFLGISFTGISSLPADIFSDLDRLEGLFLDNNQIVSLPEDVFEGLPNLELLNLSNNRNLTNLPDNLLRGLTELTSLRLENSGADIHFVVSLQMDGDRMFRARLATGAPFPITVPVLNNNNNELFETLTIDTGSTQSPSVSLPAGVSVEAGRSIDSLYHIGMLPTLPTTTNSDNERDHQGYRVQRFLPSEVVVPDITVVSVDAAIPDGTYGLDVSIDITVQFSEPVVVTGVTPPPPV